MRGVGVLACLMIALGVAAAVAEAFAPADERRAEGELAGIRNMPALAMEFVGDGGEVERFLGARDADGDSAMRRKLRRSLAWDNVFIAAYWLLFTGLAALLAQRVGARAALWLAVFAAVCATGAAISDTVENARTAALLDAASVTKLMLKGVAAASFEKWLLVGLATLVLSPVFLWRGERWSVVAGGGLFLLYLTVGVLTLAGILGGSARLVLTAFGLNFIGVVVIAVLFNVWPRRVAGRL